MADVVLKRHCKLLSFFTIIIIKSERHDQCRRVPPLIQNDKEPHVVRHFLNSTATRLHVQRVYSFTDCVDIAGPD